jgi:flagellar capping protein FliD
MTRFSRLGCGLLLGALLWSGLVPAAPAQQTRTLTIRDGTVHVDGRQLSADQLPGDLDLAGITARYRFVGIQRPVIELNGRLFALDDGLRPVSEEEVNAEKSSVILQEIDARPSALSSDGRATRSPSAASRSVEGTRAAQQRYLSDVQKANRELYERLVRERTMERQAEDLARVIRMLPDDSDERRAKADTLQALLNDIFDLKQENRRREIERLQREIQELQRSLQKRKQMREAMIEHRFNQLVRTSSNR